MSKKILVITDLDNVWLLPTWAKIISKQSSKYEIQSILCVPPVLASKRGFKSKLWFLFTFGLWESVLLQFYYLMITTTQMRKISNGISASKTEIVNLKSYDENRILAIIDQISPDFIFITTSNIISRELLENSKVKWFNKHSSLLPNFRGLFPYLYSTYYGADIGYSIHEVEAKIDSGKIVLQREIEASNSMVDFYKRVYCSFVECFEFFVDSIDSEKEFNPAIYDTRIFSLPTRTFVKSWRKKGFKLITLKDFISD